MHDREWKRYFRSEFETVEFQGAVRGMLLDISAAGPMERPALAASFGGFVRNSQCHIRIVLAKSMMAQLGITPTQHVASMLMKHAFGKAASTHTLDWYFADPARDASVKYTNEARRILRQRQDQVDRYGGLYGWYCEELKHRIKSIRAAVRRRR